jgi:branched-chain amino acid aminotransferase
MRSRLQTMYVAEWTQEKGWDSGKLVPYGPITVMPSAQVLNYGQAIFEGMKVRLHAAWSFANDGLIPTR